jgi:hypothetical protein
LQKETLSFSLGIRIFPGVYLSIAHFWPGDGIQEASANSLQEMQLKLLQKQVSRLYDESEEDDFAMLF